MCPLHNAVIGACRVSSRVVEQALIETQNKGVSWSNPNFARLLADRLELRADALTLYGIGDERSYRWWRDTFTREEVIIENSVAARSTAIIGTFFSDGRVVVVSGREHCTAILIPSLVVASLLFPTVRFEIEFKRLVPQFLFLPERRSKLRLHCDQTNWSPEPCVCVARNGSLEISSATLSEVQKCANFLS